MSSQSAWPVVELQAWFHNTCKTPASAADSWGRTLLAGAFSLPGYGGFVFAVAGSMTFYLLSGVMYKPEAVQHFCILRVLSSEMILAGSYFIIKMWSEQISILNSNSCLSDMD